MDVKNLTKEMLCHVFDHTNLKPYASKKEFQKLCQEAADNHFAMVAINSSPVAYCKSLLNGTSVHVGAAIAFPLGQTTLSSKLFETKNAIENGADEIDYVINVGEVKNQNFNYIRQEMREITQLCHTENVICKAIFENCYLTKEEIKKIAEIAEFIHPDFIKTSTGFGTSGATAEDVFLMKKIVGNAVKVKAAGGIRSWKTCQAMLEAGAERIGASSSLKILNEFISASKH